MLPRRLRLAEVASWPVDGDADLAMVDDLARLRLAACRLGYRVRLRHPGARLVELLRLTGLGAVLPAESGRNPQGEIIAADRPGR